MIVTRSVKCYFTKWLTKKKLRSLRRFLSEYHRVATESIKLNEKRILQGERKMTLLLTDKILKVLFSDDVDYVECVDDEDGE